MSAIPDVSVGTPDEDSLNRNGFASAIAQLILDAPAKSSLRIGVYGDWGEGKTSVLKLIEFNVRAGGGSCVWLRPWASASRQELLEQLLIELATEFKLDDNAIKRAHQGARVARQIREGTTADWRTGLVGAILGPAVEAFMHRRVEGLVSGLFNDVSRQLGDRKLVVLVDDIDRLRPSLTAEVLLTLRETLDQPDYYYVMALAPDVVQRALESVNEKWGGTGRFLEKIIELPRYLPTPTDAEWQAYVERLLSSLGPAIRRDTITGVMDLLPRNPRKTKLYLRYMASLAGSLARFDEAEIDWYGLYLCQMLVVEYPEETLALLQDAEAIKEIEYHTFLDREEARGGDGTAKPLAETKHAPQRPEDKGRFLHLCSALRERGYLRPGAYSLRELFTVAEQPPQLTWKEAEELISRYKQEGIKALKLWIEADRAHQTHRAQSLFQIVLQGRGNALDAAAQVELDAEVRSHLDESSTYLQIVKDLIRELDAFRTGLLGPDDWGALFDQFTHWTHFDRPEFYARVREEERRTLEQTITAIPLEIQLAILARHLRYDHPSGKHSPEFVETLTRIRTLIEEAAASSLVERFRVRDGIEAFWGEKGRSPEKDILFNPDSLFHRSREVRNSLSALGERATEDRIIQLNFLTYLRMLAYGARRGGSFPADACITLLRDRELLSVVWSSAVASPLNPRTTGSLREDRAALMKRGIDAGIMPIPKWWQHLEEVFFRTPATGEGPP